MQMDQLHQSAIRKPIDSVCRPAPSPRIAYKARWLPHCWIDHQHTIPLMRWIYGWLNLLTEFDFETLAVDTKAICISWTEECTGKSEANFSTGAGRTLVKFIKFSSQIHQHSFTIWAMKWDFCICKLLKWIGNRFCSRRYACFRIIVSGLCAACKRYDMQRTETGTFWHEFQRFETVET